MNRKVEEATAWVYRGIWAVLARWFRVPDKPPTLPGSPKEMQSFRPAGGFLRYLKFQFWVALTLIDAAIVILWLGLTVAYPMIGLWLAPLAFAIAVLPDVVAYVAIHLRYDTTWYVLSDRSLRIRRGIWVIHETTITFENIQNVTVESGPLQRWFKIADVIVDTAGGGKPSKEEGHQATNFHRGLIEGVSNAPYLRDLILSRVRRSRFAGIGDEIVPASGWTSQHIAVLRDIRDGLRELGT